MANIDSPHGCRQIGHIFGVQPEVQEYTKPSSYGTALLIGDVVTQVTAGTLEILTTPGTTVSTGVNLNYGAASTATTHLVYSDPFTLYEAQDNSDTDGFVLADAGGNVNIECSAGSSVTKISGHELDESTHSTTATLDFHLRKLYAHPNNEYGAWGRWEIAFNMHRAATGTVGLG